MWIGLHVQHSETYRFLTCTEKYSNTKFHENPSHESRMVRAETRAEGLTESHDEANSRFSYICKIV